MKLKRNMAMRATSIVVLGALILLSAQLLVGATIEYEWIETVEGTPVNEVIHTVNFEDKNAGQLPAVNAEYASDVVHGGSVSLHLVGSADTSVNVAYKTTTWQDEKYATFDFSVWLKAENLAGDNPAVVVSSFNTGVEDVIITDPTGDWQEVTLKGCTIGNEDKNHYFTVGFAPGTTGDLWVDDLTVTKVKNPPERELVMVEYEFADVPKGFWARNNILNLYNNGIVAGKSDTEFRPDDSITREEFAKIAVLASCNVKSKNTGTFSDVTGGNWYEPYVETAAAENLVSGMGDSSFGVGAPITRQDAAVILDRIMTNKDIAPVGESKDFADSRAIADYAKDAVSRLSAAGYIGGDETGKFNPAAPITRAEVCAIIDRMDIVENRYPDFLYRMMPEGEEDPDGELVYKQSFDSAESLADDEALSKLFYQNDGNGGNGCVAITNEAYDTVVFNIPKGLRQPYWYEKTVNFSLYIKSELNDEAKITLTPSTTIASTGRVTTGTAVTVTGPTDGWTQQKLTVKMDVSTTGFTTAQVTVKIENATSGNVYFDDLTMKSPIHPLAAALLAPNYKGLIYDENGANKGESDIILRTWMHPDYMIESIEDTRLLVEILDLENFVVLSSEDDTVQDRMNVTFSSKYLDYGDYLLKISLISKIDGREIDSVSTILRKRQGSITDLKSYIDDTGVYVNNGKRELIIAAYTAGHLDSRNGGVNGYDQMDDSVVNIAIASWGGYNSLYTDSELGYIHESDVRIIGPASFYTHKKSVYVDSIPEERTTTEQVVRAHLDNDRMMGWYLEDEPNPYTSRDKLYWHHEIINSLDLERPVYMADNKWNEFNGFDKNFAVDAIGEDRYTITRNENDTTIGYQGPMVQRLKRGFQNKPVWHILQMYNTAHDYGKDDPNYQAPSEQQQINMFMQSICAGATGVSWYHWSSYYLGLNGETYDELRTRTVNASKLFRAYEDIIMSPEEPPVFSTTGGDWLQCTSRRYNGKSYLLMCNGTIEANTASFMLDGATSARNMLTGESYAVDDEGIFEVPLDNIEVAIIEIEQPDYLSTDSEIRSIAFYSGEQGFMVRETENGLVVDVPEGTEEISYNVFCNDKATLYVNDEESDKTGLVPGDKVTFRLVSEDRGYTDIVKVTINRK